MNRELSARVSQDAFEKRYAASQDPWNFGSSDYELNRYDCVMRALARPRYGMVYEPGCSVGVLTEKMSTVADRVIAADIAPSAVERARARCRHLDNVEVLCASVAEHAPPAALDLVVFSEIGYYFEIRELARITIGLAERLQSGGEFVAVHWLGKSEDHVLHGDQVHATLKETLPLSWLKGETHPSFRIDSWIKS